MQQKSRSEVYHIGKTFGFCWYGATSHNLHLEKHAKVERCKTPKFRQIGKQDVLDASLSLVPR